MNILNSRLAILIKIKQFKYFLFYYMSHMSTNILDLKQGSVYLIRYVYDKVGIMKALSVNIKSLMVIWILNL